MTYEKEMKVDPVHYYFKCPDTGIEMSFTRLLDFGWTVGFPNLDFEEAVMYNWCIPWPELSEEEQKRVDENYANLKKRMEESD